MIGWAGGRIAMDRKRRRKVRDRKRDEDEWGGFVPWMEVFWLDWGDILASLKGK